MVYLYRVKRQGLNAVLSTQNEEKPIKMARIDSLVAEEMVPIGDRAAVRYRLSIYAW
jgi:hypothetical protein